MRGLIAHCQSPGAPAGNRVGAALRASACVFRDESSIHARGANIVTAAVYTTACTASRAAMGGRFVRVMPSPPPPPAASGTAPRSPRR